MLRDKGIRPGGIPLPDWSESASRRIMALNGIGTAILSVSTPGAWFGDVTETRYWARHLNEYAAELVERRPDRFGFFATLTLPDVDGAIAEAEYALDTLHADGVILLANNAGLYLGDPEFDRLLAFLDERAAVVFIHPGESPAEPVPGVPTFTADFLLDTTRTAISLIMSGAMEKYTRIRFILSHAGGFLPYASYRVLLAMLREEPTLKRVGMLLNQDQVIKEKMSVFRRFWYDTALSSSRAVFPSLLESAGPDRILFGSDYPFAPGIGVKFMTGRYESEDASVITERVREMIDRGNAEALFPRLA
jgi:predicted TIM-barrel fold metal-dependent hydrolase